jgi:hypothetical protein
MKLIESSSGDFNSRFVDGLDLIFKTMGFETKAVSSKSIGLDHLATRFEIFKMNVFNQTGAFEIQGIITSIYIDAFGVDHRAHRTISKENAVLKSFQKGMSHDPQHFSETLKAVATAKDLFCKVELSACP